MQPMRTGATRSIAPPWILALAVGILLMAAVPAEGRAPAGKNYFLVTVGLFTAHEVDALCARFTRDRVCFEGGPCGSWERVRSDGRTSTLRFDIDYVLSGESVALDGEMSLDARGTGSALGGSGRLAYLDEELNFSLAGRLSRRRECRRLVADFREVMDSFDSAQCLGRADFGSPQSSAYILPYEVGSAYNVSQSYCDSQGGSHRAKFAYDFDLPIGAPVLAARDGTVFSVIDGFEDGNTTDVNHVMIEHADGSVAYYAHIRYRGSQVQRGDRVATGQVIALSGDTGDPRAWPHLHFQIQADRKSFDEYSVPVNFRNADGPLDERGGLRPGVTYLALPW